MAGIDNIRAGGSFGTQPRTTSRTDNTYSSPTSGRTRTSQVQDEVSLSTQSRAMGEIHQDMAVSPSFDSAKVAAIKEAIANGSYVVNPERLADNIIRFEQELNELS